MNIKYFYILIILTFFKSGTTNCFFFDTIYKFVSGLINRDWSKDLNTAQAYKEILKKANQLIGEIETEIYEITLGNNSNYTSNLVRTFKGFLQTVVYHYDNKTETNHFNSSRTNKHGGDANITSEEKNEKETFGEKIENIVENVADFLIPDNPELFVKGILKGISIVPYNNNKCYHNLGNRTTSLVEHFRMIITSFTTGGSLMTDLLNLYNFLGDIKESQGVDLSGCRFVELFGAVSAISGSVGTAKLVWKIIYNYEPVYKNIINIYYAKDAEQAGESFGELIKLILNYHTD